MTEHNVRADMLEREMLARYAAGSLEQIDARQLETFRASAGMSVVDPAWALLIGKRRAAGPDRDVKVSELETWPDTNLHALMIRPEIDRSVRENAALELYRRASKFVRTPEFATFLTSCIDRELVERKAGHEPSRVLDALWRLNEKAEASRIALAGVDRVHTEAEGYLRDALERPMETLRAEADAQGESLRQAIATVRKAVKKLAILLSSATCLAALVLVLHQFHVV